MKALSLILLTCVLLLACSACGPQPSEPEQPEELSAASMTDDSAVSEAVTSSESDTDTAETFDDESADGVFGWVTEDWGDGPIDVFYGGVDIG